jgi:cytochrome c oxidase subunit 2
MVMFFMMPYWHLYGRQNLSSETYRVTPALFQKAATEMTAKYTVRTETDQKIPVVRPPVGSDVFLVARLWAFWPILELEEGKTYRLHLTAMDYNHGFSLQPENINIQLVPGYEHVVTITPNRAGTYAIVCNEFCGIGHHTMVSRLYVVKAN